MMVLEEDEKFRRRTGMTLIYNIRIVSQSSVHGLAVVA